VIIVNLDEVCPDELEFIIKVLKYSNFKDHKIFVIVSTIMTWSRVEEKGSSHSEQEIYTDQDSAARRAYSQYETFM
jgi:hypothetical protein